MRIVQICPCPYPSLGGPAKTFQQFHEAVELETIAFVRPSEGCGETAVVPIAVSVRTRDWPGLGKYYSATAAELKAAEALVAQADCVFIHNFFLYPSIWAMRMCRRYGVPYVVVLHGILDPWALKKSRWVKRLWLAFGGRQVLRHAAGVLCATQREREKAAQFFTDEQAQVVKWPCEAPELAPLREHRLALRLKLGFAEGDRILIYLGRLHSMKRPLETVQLLAGLGDPRLKLLMVGPDWDVTRVQLQAEARRLGWHGLKAVGPVFGREKYAYLDASDGYISLSHRENFNYTLAEAMGACLPPIVSPGNDLGWEFGEVGFSWQLQSDAPAEAAAAVREFMALPKAELARRGAAARDWARQNLGSARFADELQRVIGQVTTKALRRGPVRTRRLSSDRLRILHYTPTYAPAWSYGGPPRSVANLCEGLVAAGHEVAVLTTNAGLVGDPQIPTDRWVERNGVRVRYFPYTRGHAGIAAPELVAAVKKEVAGYDLLHVTGVWQITSHAAAEAAQAAGVPFICSPRGALGRYSFSQKAWKKWPYYWLWERRCLSAAAAIHYTSRMEIEECGRLGLGVRGFAVPNSIDLRAWKRDEIGAAEWRVKRGIGSQEAVFLYAGRLHHKKGLDILPGICAALPRDAAWRLALVGFDEDMTGEWLRREFARLGLSSRLVLLEGVGSRELAAIYSAARVFVFPSRHENFGNVAVEALACGCRVLLSDQVGAWHELAEMDGVTVLPRAVEPWTEALQRLLTQSEAETVVSRMKLESRFSQAAVARAMAAEYARIIR